MVSSVLLVQVGDSDVELLFGGDRDKTLTLPGSSYKPTETSDFDDACRYFARDVGELLSKDELAEWLYAEVTVESVESALYIVQIDPALGSRLPTAFERVRPSFSSLTHTNLIWVSWRALLAAAKSFDPQAASIGSTLRGSFHDCRLPTHVIQLVTEFEDEIGLHTNQLGEDHELSKMYGEVQAKTKDRQFAQSLDWSLRLNNSPLPALEILQPHEPDHKAMLALLPSHIAWRVVSIRRVRAPVQHNDFEQHKETLSAPVEVKESLFHGTPERWRATAIALHGFDTSIRLNGRTFGDGVYATSHVPTALHYAGVRGSIVLLRGLIASNGGKVVKQSRLHNHIHVFPDPKAVLPLLIADYAEEEEEEEEQVSTN